MANLQRTPPAGKSTANNNTSLTKKRQRIDDQSWENMTSMDDAAGPCSISLDGMMKMMLQQFAETRQLIDTVRGEIRDVNKRIDVVKTELKDDIKSVKDECAAKLQQHDSALVSLNKRMDSVSHKLGALENRNELIISGVPSVDGENLQSTVNAIGRHLAVKSATTQMVETRRIKPGPNSDRDGLIVVEFALKAARDEFYGAYLRERNLKLRHIGLDSDRRIYINESLTTEARKLKSAALHLKKLGKLTSVYTKQGVVHVKPTGSELAVVIRSENDLQKYS